MFRYSKFDFITKSNKKTKFILKFIINVIIITFIIIIFLINIDTKNNVKIISSNSRRIISNLHNYTETMSNFIASGSNNDNNNDNNNENNNNNNDDNNNNEIKNIRLTIDYFKELKEQELKEIKEREIKELKERELKELKELKEQEIKEQELKELKKREMKEKAIKLIKSYIIDYYNSYIHLVPSYSKKYGYADNNDCLKELIKINNDELFNKLIKIDYENSEVSFNYLYENNEYYKNTNNIIETHIYNNYDENNIYYNYSHYLYGNFKENIIKNPLYQIIKEQLEIDYSYTEPNLTDEYNNKSKYFQKSLNDFKETYSNYNGYEKYYENYENDTYYLYNKYVSYSYGTDVYHSNIDHYSFYYNEFIINNEIIINNPNLDNYYNKLYNFYKYICHIPSMYIINEMQKPTIKNYYFNSFSIYGNWCYGRVSSCGYTINKNNIEEFLNINLNDYIIRGYYRSDGKYYIIEAFNSNYYYYSSNINNELDKNKGSRMIKHNITNNFPEHLNNGKDWVKIQNHYFIEKVYIDFPLISNIIYNEYEYIQKILLNIANIYYLPIIPPIKFDLRN
jgi:hypothetical protein